MVFTKWVGLLVLMTGCAKQPDCVEFPVVYEAWGSACASLSATEDKGFIHIDLNDGFKLIWTSLSLYGGPEDVTRIAEADMPDDMKEWILTNKTDYIPQDMLTEPFYDGEYAWIDYGGVSCLVFGRRCHESEADLDRRNREWLHNIPTSYLKMSFTGFDVSGGYKNIGYIVIILRCEDDNGVSRDLCAILNRADLKRFKVGNPRE